MACCIWAPFLSEAVEASWCYFFENWFMKLKFPNLLKPLGTIFQQNYWSFYPSELIYFVLFTMRHPVNATSKIISHPCELLDTSCIFPRVWFKPFLKCPSTISHLENILLQCKELLEECEILLTFFSSQVDNFYICCWFILSCVDSWFIIK